MGIDTYSDLVAAFNNEVARTETARIDNLIAQVEADLNANRYFRLAEMQTSQTINTVAGTSTITLDSDLLQLDEISLNGNPQALRFMPENLMNVRYSDQSYVDRPEFYCLRGNRTIRLAATPDAVYQVGVLYKEKIPALTSGSPTNWLLSKNPNVYLHGCAFFLSSKIKDANQFATYEKLYSRVVNMLIDADQGYMYPNTGLSMYAVDR